MLYSNNNTVWFVNNPAYHFTVGAGKPVILDTNFAVPCSGATVSLSGCTIFGGFTAVNTANIHIHIMYNNNISTTTKYVLRVRYPQTTLSYKNA